MYEHDPLLSPPPSMSPMTPCPSIPVVSTHSKFRDKNLTNSKKKVYERGKQLRAKEGRI